jgi:hypothetical protein
MRNHKNEFCFCVMLFFVGLKQRKKRIEKEDPKKIGFREEV